jgi:hypothetical protein
MGHFKSLVCTVSQVISPNGSSKKPAYIIELPEPVFLTFRLQDEAGGGKGHQTTFVQGHMTLHTGGGGREGRAL